ncbi:hypothetical protein D9758_012409 [Tetrapyrgos nigripes]|uniref:RBR-type E3 ubiquitin transferase n=1 Tax=Tetrapyrgos nigripes TaxID=182062 RepID=A0A8H5FZ22_9AGAR|nr:hypothetical protein D9758_012409 [Tetrapyrgos nigripes]
MALHDIDAATSLLIAQLALQDIEEYNSSLGLEVTGETDEQIAFRLLEEDFELYLQEHGRTRDRMSRSTIMGNGGGQQRQQQSLPERPLSPASSIDYVDDLADDDDEVELPRPIEPRAGLPGLSSFSLPSASSTSDLSYIATPSPEPVAEDYISETRRCLVCSETISPLTYFEAPCGHFYCESCLEDFVNSSVQDESSFPPQCCRKPFPLGPDLLEPSPSSSSSRTSTSSTSSNYSISLALSNSNWTLVRRLHEKSREFSIASKDRVYCPNPRCSIFIGSTNTLPTLALKHSPSQFLCPSCNTTICRHCKQLQSAHIHHVLGRPQCPPSPSELLDRQARDLAKSQKWQTCPGCKHMVEKTEGCFHMVCRCGEEFCYGCGEKWTRGTVCVCGGREE